MLQALRLHRARCGFPPAVSEQAGMPHRDVAGPPYTQMWRWPPAGRRLAEPASQRCCRARLCSMTSAHTNPPARFASHTSVCNHRAALGDLPERQYALLAAATVTACNKGTPSQAWQLLPEKQVKPAAYRLMSRPQMCLHVLVMACSACCTS